MRPLEYGAGERRRVQSHGAPDSDQGRDHHAEAEGPGEGHHEEDVQARVDAGVAGAAGDQDVSGGNQKEKDRILMKHAQYAA